VIPQRDIPRVVHEILDAMHDESGWEEASEREIVEALLAMRRSASVQDTADRLRRQFVFLREVTLVPERVLLHLALERDARDAERARGVRDVAVVLLQHARDVRRFERVARARRSTDASSGVRPRRRRRGRARARRPRAAATDASCRSSRRRSRAPRRGRARS
jgi:hypothetical protein